MAGACAGKAMITGVKEKGTYGFLLGSMIQYGMPDWDKFLDYAWKNLSCEMTKDFLIVNHPGLGRFLYSDGKAWVETATSPYCKEGYWAGDYQQVFVPNTIDIEQYVESRTILEDIFLKNVFEGALTKQGLLERFPYYKFLDIKYSEIWLSGDKRNELYRLSAFSIEEIEEMAREYTRINDEAKASIMALIKRGSLRINR